MQNLYFVGVSTAHSSIMTIFPAWAKELGLSAEMRGIDLPLPGRPEDRSFQDERSSRLGLVAGDAHGKRAGEVTGELVADRRFVKGSSS